MRQDTLLVLALVAVAAVVVLSAKQPAAPAPAAAPLTQEKILAFIDQCSSELLTSGRDHVACALNGNFVQLKDSGIFRTGELFSVQANLQRLNKFYDDAYYVCWSQGDYEKAPSPKRFTEHPQFDGTYLGREFSCSSEPFYQRDFHLIAAKGFAPPGKGKFFVIDAYIFPDGDYKSADDFLARMDEAKKVFSFEGDVS